MSNVTGKREATLLDGTPDKRLFWSIISDYDLVTALCELIDNALDQWMGTNQQRPLLVKLTLDADRQLISVKDNAGGVGKPDLSILIAPGVSRNNPTAESIGIFGVGSKRAVVALAENVVIKTHRKGDKSYQIDVTSDWLESSSWEIPAYEIPEVAEGETSIDLSALRKTFAKGDIDHLLQHLGETYAWFLEQKGCTIIVNGEAVQPLCFENWAYPPGFPPQRAVFDADLSGSGTVRVDMTAGLVTDRDPETDNYGVYFYCNNRLIVKALKVREVGYFISSEAGVPHPDASLCRVIVRLNGEAKLMPWNSSKTGINYSHPLFQTTRPSLIQLVSQFSSLSRRLKEDWRGKVFAYSSGEIQPLDSELIAHGKKLVLPPLPRVNKPHVETLKAQNKKRIANQPWTLGLVEAVAAVTVMCRQRFETKNRIALILLDSNFEIALKEFLVHRNDLFPPKTYTNTKIRDLFRNRNNVIAEVAGKIAIPNDLIVKAKHYYELRNKLIHERATVGVTDADIDNYDDVVRKVLSILFDLTL